MTAPPASPTTPEPPDIATCRARVVDGEVSAVEVARATLAAAGREPWGALLALDGEGALAQAAQLDRRGRAGDPPGLLAGVPLVVKDNLTTRGVVTTAGSRILADWVPPYDAHVVQRLRAEGAVLVAKGNMDELGMGSSTEHSAFGPTRNPWSPEHVPGGSSGGPAAAVAGGLVPGALGTDTGGSVRQPAAYCGITGLRPTYGRISRYGLIAFASSLDQVGPLGRTVADCARLFAAIEGPDPRDATSRAAPPGQPGGADWISVARPERLDGLRVGVLEDWVAAASPPVRGAVEAAGQALADAGAALSPVRLVEDERSLAAYYVIAPAEASSNLARLDGMRFGRRSDDADLEGTFEASRHEGLGPEVRRRILLGTYVLSAGYYDAYYQRAVAARDALRRELAGLFETHDVLLGPTAPGPAFRFGEKLGDPLSMYLTDAFTLPAGLAGLPALSGPAGRSPDGLPLAYQLVGPAFREDVLFRAGAVVEDRLGVLAPPAMERTP